MGGTKERNLESYSKNSGRDVVKMNIIFMLKEQAGFVSLKGVGLQDVQNAEKILGLKFSQEYREYVQEFGAASFRGHELTGICNIPYLNVVDVTMTDRELMQNIDPSWYVIEEAHIDGIVIWQDSVGYVYQTSPSGLPVKIADSLLEYIRL